MGNDADLWCPRLPPPKDIDSEPRTHQRRFDNALGCVRLPSIRTRAPALAYIGTLDGFRGIAILVVMLFHFSWAFGEGTTASHLIKHVFWTGWFGVDLFFVLSGFLITRGLLIESTHTVMQRLRNFWLRRVLRIFPLYYAAILVGTILGLATSARIPEWPYWVYAQNYSLAFDSDPERWTSHLWSLAIEEQFYLAWPALLLEPVYQKFGPKSRP